MKIVNTARIREMKWRSPKGKFGGFSKGVSEALGRKPRSTDLLERHPFDVELLRLAPGQTPYPHHAHSAQWEFYLVLAGRGRVRDARRWKPIGPGDAFLFKPGEAHQLRNDGAADLLICVIADNPVGECCHYPDSDKWFVPLPKRQLHRAKLVKYYAGEE